jgi:hypothetical protein
MAAQNKILRGYYGAVPVDKMTGWARRLAWFRVAFAGFANCLLGVFYRLRTLAPPEIERISQMATGAAFQVWQPEAAPDGFSVVGVEVAPYSRDALTIVLADNRGRSFEIMQRRQWLPIAEELTTARLPFHRVPFVSCPLFAVHGRHGGEPIDHAYWTSRQSVHIEQNGLVLEFREVKGQGPGFATLIHYAARSWQSVAAAHVPHDLKTGGRK